MGRFDWAILSESDPHSLRYSFGYPESRSEANPKSHDLVVIPIDKLSTQDQEFLSSKEALQTQGKMQITQTWTMKNGMTVIGRVVDYVRKNVTIQRRRGKVYVNDQLLKPAGKNG